MQGACQNLEPLSKKHYFCWNINLLFFFSDVPHPHLTASMAAVRRGLGSRCCTHQRAKTSFRQSYRNVITASHLFKILNSNSRFLAINIYQIVYNDDIFVRICKHRLGGWRQAMVSDPWRPWKMPSIPRGHSPVNICERSGDQGPWTERCRTNRSKNKQIQKETAKWTEFN